MKRRPCNISTAVLKVVVVLVVCYLRHAFGLGKHYNRTKRLLFGAHERGGGAGWCSSGR